MKCSALKMAIATFELTSRLAEYIGLISLFDLPTICDRRHSRLK
jgi:hypothetical protein